MAVWYITSVPGSEPFSVSEMKNYLKIESSITDDDTLIGQLIQDARFFVERATQRALITQTITEFLDTWPLADDKEPRVIVPSVAPVRAITSVKYVAEGGTPASYTTWALTNYTSDLISGKNNYGGARIVKNPDVDWPTLANYKNAIEIVYPAGYGTSAEIPGGLRQAIRRLVSIWYHHRTTFQDDYDHVKKLIEPYKVFK